MVQRKLWPRYNPVIFFKITKIFFSGSLTTNEYTPYAKRIYRNWLLKYEKNKERMMARLEKCGLQSISHSRRNKGRNRRQATEEEILEGNGQKSIISSFLASFR